MTAPQAEPFQNNEMQALFAGLVGEAGLVVGVSGGPDSMALMGALSVWRESGGNSKRIYVATVDHGLRPDSAEEAAMVARQAQRMGFPFKLLCWRGEKPRTGLQEVARNARYRLLLDFCHEIGASALLTAHTADDQAETILMRMARGSGLAGLRGMAHVSLRDGIRHRRPFLAVEKSRLIATCRAHDWPFVEDPSNRSECFTRVRWRQLMPELAQEGLNAARFVSLAERLTRADEALDIKAGEAYRAALMPQDDSSMISLDGGLLFREPFEIVIRVLLRALAHFGCEGIDCRLQRIENCVNALFDAFHTGRKVRRTLGGTMVSLDLGQRLNIQLEPERKRGRLMDDSAEVASRRPSSLGKDVSST